MRRTISFALLGLLVTAALATGAAAQVLSVDKRHIDFGDMKQMEDREDEIIVTNTGTLTLVISGVDADCGCTIPELAKDTLAPGESTVIKLLFNSKKFVGPTTKMVHINSNDPNNPTVSIMLTSTINTPIMQSTAIPKSGFRTR